MARQIALTLALVATLTAEPAAQSAPPAELPVADEAQWIGEPPAAAVTPARYGEDEPRPAAPTAPNPFDSRADRYGAPAPAAPAAAAPAPSRPLTPLGAAPSAGAALEPVGAPRVERARVSKGSGKLPNDAGQVWREYDLRPYTTRPTSDPKPQQRVVDWVLRETGYEAWHGETVGVLNATRDALTVYHTPAMQAIVAEVVDRFVNGRAAEQAFSMRVLTVRNPDWRVRALGLTTPVGVQSPGVQAWIMPKENYALLAAELGRRTDVRDYTATGQLVPHGQSTVFSTMRARPYTKGIVPTQAAWPGYQPESGQVEEGASLEFSPLLSLDLGTAEAVVKLRLAQVEKMRRVSFDLPTPGAPAGSTPGQRLQIEVPQITGANLHERFRWPASHVLLLSMGMVATPGPDSAGSLGEMLPDAMRSPPRADALLFVEVRPAAAPTAAPQIDPRSGRLSTAARPTTTFPGRY